jgi:large subunit ribosomal protein L21
MYAIVDIAGQQFKVEKDQEIFVHRLESEEGAEIHFANVLLVDDNGHIKVGMPVLEGASVTATILSHLKGKKVLVFKKKRRKGYQKTNGHRDYLTKIRIENIVSEGLKIMKAEESVESVEPAITKTTKPSASKKPVKKAVIEAIPVPVEVVTADKNIPAKKTRTKTTARKKMDDQAEAKPEKES